MKRLLALVLMLAFTIGLVGCGKTEEKPELTLTGPVSVEVGKTIQLSAVITPATADQSVTWTSVAPAIATVDATGKVTGVKDGATVIRVASVAYPELTKQLMLRVNASGDESFPDLQQYTIRIAQAGHALYELDPFHDDYKASDKLAKQQAWNYVEEKFNVNIEVVAYPDDAEWGTPRWQYIEQQAASNVADYDFYTVPDSQIGRFVEANAILDITEWYALYGNGYMNEVYRQSGSYKGKIYSITDGESGIYNVMYYNIGLLEQLNMEKSPAQMFLDGEWTYTAFKNYAIAAQAKLDELTTAEAAYYAVAGNSPYYWVGMSNAGGVKLADVSTYQINVKDPIAVAAATTLREIKAANAMDPAKQVDAGVTSWMQGRSLFASGDLWFVNTSNRWPEDLWGEGTTRYGYVPFPRPDGTELTDQKIGLGGTATWVMPIGRDTEYAKHGPDATAENIYRAIVTAFQKTEEFLVNDPLYDEEVLTRTFAQRYAASEDSVNAFIWMHTRINEIGFYDPMSTPDNPVVNTGYSTFSTNVNNFVMGTAASFADAVDPLIGTLQEALYKAFS